MASALRLIGFGLLLTGLVGFAHLTHAQEATPGPGGRQIELPDRRILTYSPDGTALATYTRDADQGDQLCVVEVATLQDRVCGDLSGIEAGLREENVVWSPDSSKLAFSEESFQTFIDGDLWVMDAQSGEVTNVADDSYSGRIPLHDSGAAFS